MTAPEVDPAAVEAAYNAWSSATPRGWGSRAPMRAALTAAYPLLVADKDAHERTRIAEELREQANLRFEQHGPFDGRGEAFWDTYIWLTEEDGRSLREVIDEPPRSDP